MTFRTELFQLRTTIQFLNRYSFSQFVMYHIWWLKCLILGLLKIPFNGDKHAVFKITIAQKFQFPKVQS